MIAFLLGASVLWLGNQPCQIQAEATANPTVAVLNPTGAAWDVVGEGEDYFTQVLHNPHEMDHKTDLLWQVFGINNIVFANGLWTGTVNNTGGYSAVFPLYPGYTAHSSGDYNDQSAAEIGQTGWNYPIDAEKYSLLSFRLKAPASAGRPDGWWHAAYTNLSFTLESGHVEGHYAAQADAWQVYTMTLPWHSPIYGLEFRFGPATGVYQFDWLRLTDPATSPVYMITFFVNNAQVGDRVDLWCYTAAAATPDDACGPIATGLSVDAPGGYRYAWRTAYLPPGHYYVKAIVQRGTIEASALSAGPLTIQAAPLLTFDSPSMTSGPDYATEVLGNPWDMNDEEDIFGYEDFYRQPHDFAAGCPCFANGELSGTVARLDPNDPPGFSDPFVYLRVGYRKPIDTAKYKYLTYRYKIDRAGWWPNSGDRLIYDESRQVYPAGWLVRGVFFGVFPPDVVKASDSLNDLIVFDGWNTYSLDLSQALARGYWEPNDYQTGGYWTGLKYAFRFDLLEGTDLWSIHLDDVKLTGDDTATTAYTVNWSWQNKGEAQKIDFWANPNPKTCLTEGTLIHQVSGGSATLPLAGAYRAFLPLISLPVDDANHFVWDTSAVAAGAYYLCAKINDKYNTTTAVSEAAVVVLH